MIRQVPHMLAVPGGVLLMRDARSRSEREVVLSPFEMSWAPVTVAQYGDPDAPDDVPARSLTWFAALRWCNAASTGLGLRPAYQVDGRDVVWDVASDGFRLPTEAEWEWACRGGTTAPTYGPLEEVAWTAADAVDGPQPVGRKDANGYGLVDTLGNVWEWCWDHADTARYGEYRSLRGGGWADAAWHCRASVRRGTSPDALLEDVGFRVARGAVGEPAGRQAQGWSAGRDDARASMPVLPAGWTSLDGRRGPPLA